MPSFLKRITQARLYWQGLGASWSYLIASDRGDSSQELYRMFDRSYEIEESRFSQEFHYAHLMNCHEESIQCARCVVFITTFL